MSTKLQISLLTARPMHVTTYVLIVYGRYLPCFGACVRSVAITHTHDTKKTSMASRTSSLTDRVSCGVYSQYSPYLHNNNNIEK